jgi:DHA2 family methylenomycin A resistance protein-like MFS transporter
MPSTDTSVQLAGDERRSPWPLLAICSGYFMVILDTTVVNVALPQLSHSMHASTSDLQWVVDSYSLTFAALLLSGGMISDTRGAKRVFIGGIALFCVCSLACGLAPNVGLLIAARAAQGIGAALSVPASLSLIQATYSERSARRRALGAWGAVAGIGGGGGPVVGGLLVSALGWRSVFFLNVPLGAAAVVLAARVLSAPEPRARRGDPAGQLLVALALAMLTGALIESGDDGWSSPVVLIPLAVAIAAGVAFVVNERRVATPMLPLSLFSSPAFSGGTAVGLCINLGMYGELFVMTLYLQQSRGYTPVLAGLALLPQMGLLTVGSALSGRMSARSGPRRPMLIGLALGALGLLLLAGVGHTTAYPLLVVPFMLAGLGMSLTMPAATTAVIEAAPAERAGLAGGAINAARQTGGLLGIALMGSLVSAHGRFSGDSHVALAVGGCAFLLAWLISLRTAPGHKSSGLRIAPTTSSTRANPSLS